MSTYSSGWESQLTPKEVSTYKQYFKAATKSQPNLVTGMEAVQFFAKSGLPNDVLSEVNKNNRVSCLLKIHLLVLSFSSELTENFKRFGKLPMKKISVF